MKNKNHLIIASPRSGSTNYQRYVQIEYDLHGLGEIDFGIIRSPLNVSNVTAEFNVTYSENIIAQKKLEIWNTDRGAVLKMFPANIEEPNDKLVGPMVDFKEIKKHYYEYIRTADVIHFLQRDDLDAQILSNYFLRTDNIGGYEITDYNILVVIIRETLIQRAMVKYYREFIKEINNTAEIIDVKTTDLSKIINTPELKKLGLGPNIAQQSYVNKIMERDVYKRPLYKMLHEVTEQQTIALCNRYNNKPWSAYIEK